MDIDELLNKFPAKQIKAVKTIFSKLIEDGAREDVALVRAFNRGIAGKDSLDMNVQELISLIRSEKYHIDYLKTDRKTLDPDTLPIKDGFWLVPVNMTASGVNLNGQFKSAEEQKNTAEKQDGWIIPSINDHMDDFALNEETGEYEWRIEPKDFEISGFVSDVTLHRLESGEFAVRGTDHIPITEPDLLDNWGVSIGYTCDHEWKDGQYKDADYCSVQTNIMIVHNARMINQRPSIQPEPPAGQAFGAGYGVDDDKNEPNGGMNMDDKDIKALKDRIVELETQVKEFETADYTNKIKDLEAKETDLTTQLDTIQKASDEKDATITRLETEVSTLTPFKEQIDTINETKRTELVAEFNKVFADTKGEPKYDEAWVKERDDVTLTAMIDEVGNARDFKKAPAEPDKTPKPKGKDKKGEKISIEYNGKPVEVI